MPRDGTYIPSDDILDTLIRARAKFTGPKSWSSGSTPTACFLLELIGNGHRSLINWNNAPNSAVPNEHRTYEDVIDLLDRAVAKRRAMVGELVV